MTRKRRVLQTLAVFTAFVLLGSSSLAYGYTAGEKTRLEYEDILEGYSVDESIPTYRDYIDRQPQNRPSGVIEIDAAGYARYEEGGAEAEPEIYADYEGQTGDSVLTEEDAVIEYTFTVPEAGLYDLSLLYFPVEGKSSEIQRSLFLDGVLPFRELSTVEFERQWTNTVAEEAREAGQSAPVWPKDNQGNDLKPKMIEIPEWTESLLYDSDGYITDNLSLYLTEGEHVLTLMSMREPMLLRKFTFQNTEPLLSYAEVLAGWEAAGAKDVSSEALVTVQGQNAVKTSSQMLYPDQDQSSPTVSPSSAKLLLNNTIGGQSWRIAGHWIEWEFDAPESGLYEISAHVLQNFSRGIYVSRKIYIDGKVPFAEFSEYGFIYRQNWTMEKLTQKEGDPYKIFLEAGRHTVRMEAVLGSFSEIISVVREAVFELNRIYRKVIRLTGVRPDRNRDYQVAYSLPELKGELVAVRDSLQWSIDELQRIAGKRSDRERVLKTMIIQLNELIENQERFSKTVASFRINIRACGTWLTQAIDQPLRVDTITFHAPGKNMSAPNDNIFAGIWYEISRLFYSFVIDYNQIGNISEEEDTESVTLWIGSGRDQANVIKNLIDETFTRETGIGVNAMLVDMGTLLQATLAGQGPDVAIQVANDLPMNYGLRNAVQDLTQFEDLDEVLTRFRPSVMEAFTYDGAVYALPETQTFPMMFYRKDIMKELNLEVPNTWDEMKTTLAVLANNMMELGMLPTEQIFSMILYQNGGEYYNEDATRSALDSDQAINAFKKYTEFYTDYKLDKDTSVEERFRTGETPLIINDFSFYNTLQVSAPDIKGLWGFAPVPATVQEDGSLDRSVGSFGSGCIIMKSDNTPENSWEFIKWWTDAETQTLFGREMESLMGAAARHPSANIEAFAQLPWPVADYQALNRQFDSVKGIPQVPGGYFSYRNVNNAFYAVVTGSSVIGSAETVFEFPREALTDKVILINDEIDFKREEFGLTLYEDGIGGE
ncbi:MAG: extracellular solute-binding protein [Oscillospiraceae bacterium]|jgi:ABC-type glycerol-3-phosphate transport system substrate-binding protein|nr:extracellular solute-binding protein [Oscillospiraceae bacterium]